MNLVSQRIKKIRNVLKMTQAEFADQLGISQALISGIENERDNPSTTLIKLISLKFNISEKWLIDGLGDMAPDYDSYTNDGLHSKYSTFRHTLNSYADSLSGTDLQIFVDTFSIFVCIVTMKTINNEKMKSLFYAFDQCITCIDRISIKSNKSKQKDFRDVLECKSVIDKNMRIIQEIMNESLEKYISG